jgi:hypothetical protein
MADIIFARAGKRSAAGNFPIQIPLLCYLNRMDLLTRFEPLGTTHDDALSWANRSLNLHQRTLLGACLNRDPSRQTLGIDLEDVGVVFSQD